MTVEARKDLIIEDLGRRSYDDALAHQKERLIELMDGGASEGRAYLLLVEHDPPVITGGRRARPENILVSPDELSRLGVQYRPSERGGDVTWHGPGQMVAWPVLALDPRGKSVLARYVDALETIVIQTLARFGLQGRQRDGLRGVWIESRKVAAVGVAVSRWITSHGLSINVGSDLSGFDLIVPCGIRDGAVTSLSRELGAEVAMGDVKKEFIEAFMISDLWSNLVAPTRRNHL